MIVLPNYRLDLTFVDGASGIVDLSNESFAGVFEPLTEPEYFARATLENGVVTWPCGVDIAPDALYEKVCATVHHKKPEVPQSVTFG